MAERPMSRAWCGKCQYPGKSEFYLGTVVLPTTATMQQVDQELTALWFNLSPHPQPPTIAVPGYTFFQAEQGKPNA